MILIDKYNKYDFAPSQFQLECESKEYEACQFYLDQKKTLGRTAKKTPKKSGFFVTLWKRELNGPIAPFHEQDHFNSVIILIQENEHAGYFEFPVDLLIKKGIISTLTKEGKRAFRVYPPWTKTTSKQAEKTQGWQIEYFIEKE